MTPPGRESWLPAAFNGGHAYRDRVQIPQASTVDFYAGRYRHSDRRTWIARLAAGEICCNGRRLRADGPLAAGDRLVWHRPPWQEDAVPVLARDSVVFDDGDLLVLNKPSGLPVLPAGGFLEHTLLRQLESWCVDGGLGAAAGVPRPVHRLGRFTSGLVVCARSSRLRALLSAQLRESTEAGLAAMSGERMGACRKLYRAITEPLPAGWEEGETRTITTPIGRRPHPLLGQIWAAVPDGVPGGLACCSALTLLERHPGSCQVQVLIATGRPHQIRIHCAASGAPLLGDPLYLPGGQARADALPGEGGYQLQAQSLDLRRADGSRLHLAVDPLPW